MTDFDDRQKEWSLMSKNMGMHYVENGGIKFHNQDDQPFTQIDGIKYVLPRYYKNKIFPDYKLRKIGKKNYANYLKNQDRNAMHFPSLLDFEKNQRAITQLRNVDYSTTIKSKI